MFIYSFSRKDVKRALSALTTAVVCAAIIVFSLLSTAKESLVAYAMLTRTVVIDAGHGGEDSGAVGVTGALEKELNLTFSLLIGEMLEREGIRVVYTRTTDALLLNDGEDVKGLRKISDLKNRVSISRENEGAVFISIHMNAFSDETCSGLQVYARPNDEESRALAESIRRSVSETAEPDNRRAVKSGDGIYVLKNNPNVSALVECGFLSNPEECKKLCEKEFQKELSFSIVCGIIKYMNETLSGV